jgi:uncharacterized membrane protein YjgN (DUF898 family)
MEPALASTTSPDPSLRPLQLPFVFSGSGLEYFRIWLVNVALTILTLGVYSAWAKVRTNRYFWRHTHLDAASFDYVANPVAILKGRLLVLGFLLGWVVSSGVFPPADAFFSVLVLVLLPWALVRSATFRARNTTYRNLRFDFHGEYHDALVAYVLLPACLPFTLGLVYPAMIRAQRAFVVGKSAYGTQPFDFQAPLSDFYRLYAGLFGLLILLVALALLLGATISAPAALLGGVLALLLLGARMNADLLNLVFHSANLGPHRFRSGLRAGELLLLYVGNTLGILLTLGLFIPWARVRTARYRLEHLALLPAGDLDAFVAGQIDAVGSLGDEFADLFDLDLGL